MKKILLILIIVLTTLIYGAKPPYPIIFVHGLVGSDESFQETMNYLNSGNYDWGNINSYDVILNFDNANDTSVLENDVKWSDTVYGDKTIILGPRRFNYSLYDWDPDSYIFAINFKEERIKAADGWWNDQFDHSNESAIFKQGYALSKMITEVIDFTNSEKVILVGHSMGGLAIREYLQRTIDGTTSTNHKWWVNPSDNINGHKVARVVTIGTPHLGSNSGFDPSNTKYYDQKSETPPNIHSEAMRDLKYSFDAGADGIYLFGGKEWSSSLDDYFNRDINCDSAINSNIVGLNLSSASFSYNTNMPLPPNIRYTWIASNSHDGENPANWLNPIPQDPGDGCVLYSRQYLRNETGNIVPLNISDTLNVNLEHNDECDAYRHLIRGMDEPSTKELAYTISNNIEYNGSVTIQSGGGSSDQDMYRYINNKPGSVTVNLYPNASGVNTYYLYENNNGSLVQVKFGTFSTNIQFSYSLLYNSDIYLKIIGTATANTFAFPYSFKLNFSESSNVISGRITNSSGATISGVTLSGTNGIVSTTTDSNGDYSLSVPTDIWTGVITPSKSSYTFSPSQRSYSNVSTSQTSQNYTGVDSCQSVPLIPV
ncbi:MAG TPA: hypothetical protein PLK90_08505 [Clostridiales bacterium]|nr:hypothetical protein [Clostridiales bacterium]